MPGSRKRTKEEVKWCKGFAIAIRSHRQRLGMSQALMAERCGLMTRAVPCLWEKGKAVPTLYRLPAICAALKITPNKLLAESARNAVLLSANGKKSKKKRTKR